MAKLKIKTIREYWRFKRDWEIMTREETKRANELDQAEYAWSRAKMLKVQSQQRREAANKARELGLDLAPLRGRIHNLTIALGAYDGTLKTVPIEIEGM